MIKTNKSPFAKKELTAEKEVNESNVVGIVTSTGNPNTVQPCNDPAKTAHLSR